MEETISKLKTLFKQREEIDSQILALIGTEKKPVAPKKEPREKRTGRRKKEQKNYRCQECSCDFSSDAHYLKVRCEECGGKKLLEIK